MGKFLKECYIQKTNRFEALDVWEEIKMGKLLSIIYDEKKVHVEIKFGDKVLGILSDEDAKSLITFLDAGWNTFDKDGKNQPDLFIGKISKFEPNADENKRLEVAIFVNGPQELKTSEIGEEVNTQPTTT